MIELTPEQLTGGHQDEDSSLPLSTAISTSASSTALSWSVVVAGLLSAGMLLVIYGLTIAPDLTWANHSQDGGELITAAVTLGVPHPPGYPSYVLIGKLFSFLPVGTVAFRLNLLSAVSVAVAGGLLAAVLQMRSKRTGTAIAVSVAGGVAFGLLPLVWSQATIAEVYGLNLAFVAAFFFCLLALNRSGLAGFFLGLAVTGHLSSLVLLPVALYLTPSRHYVRLVVGVLLGLIPFLFVVPLSSTGSPVTWGDAQTIRGWWWLVSGELYSANLRVPLSTSELWQSLSRPYLWLGPLVILAGLLLPRLIRDGESGLSKREGTALGLSAAAFALFALLYQTKDAFVLLLPGLFILTYLAFGSFRPPLWVALFFPALLLATGYSQQNLQNDRTVRPIAEAVLTAAPPYTIVITPGDRSIFTLWYFQHVEGQRSDLVLVDANLFAFDWYREQLQAANPQLRGLLADDLPGFLNLNSHIPQCFTGLVEAGPADSNREHYTYLVGAKAQAPYLNCRVTPS